MLSFALLRDKLVIFNGLIDLGRKEKKTLEIFEWKRMDDFKCLKSNRMYLKKAIFLDLKIILNKF